MLVMPLDVFSCSAAEVKGMPLVSKFRESWSSHTTIEPVTYLVWKSYQWNLLILWATSEGSILVSVNSTVVK